ncbi:MAG TPA: COX15/CtaA family protein [Chthonomonadaceae bacterium]|nr:COX15/CtaA family protein [Chthonomonadaceae bacterium]
MTNRTAFSRYLWGLLAYNLIVILWGAYVRASFSGDGCGAHWPLCGEYLIPQHPHTKTWIELAHRVSSGLLIPAVILLWIWAMKLYEKGSQVRLGALLVVAFTFSEALVGAGLVLFKWVAHNPSVYRAVAVSTHLCNTFLLLAALVLTLWWSYGGGALRWRGQGAVGWALGVGLVGAFLMGITGTMAALGDMLYPSDSLLAGMRQDFLPTADYLLRLRPIHPMLAITVGLYLVFLAAMIRRLRPSHLTRLISLFVIGLFCFQLGIGFMNLMLRAPIWIQLEHLLIADLFWISLILLSAAALSANPVEAVEANTGIAPGKGYAIR